MELWLDIGRPSEKEVLELARRGREEARILVAIDQINGGNEAEQKIGWKTIRDFAGYEHGAIYELQIARANEEQTGKEKIFSILNYLFSPFELCRPWSVITMTTLYEIGFFKRYDGFLISEKRIKQKLALCFEGDNVYAEVACALFEKRFKGKAFQYATESVQRGETNAYHIHAIAESEKNGNEAFRDVVAKGVAHKCPLCCLWNAWGEWEEPSNSTKDIALEKISRDNALVAATAGEIKGMLLYGMMCASAFGGEEDLQEATGALLTAYICEPSEELAGWIQRVSGKTPALLGIKPAFDWMIRHLDYPMSFKALAIAGHLKNVFSKSATYLDAL